MPNRYDEPNYWKDFVYSSDDVKKVKSMRSWKYISTLLSALGKKRRGTEQSFKRDE